MPELRRQARLSTKVIVAWSLAFGALCAHLAAPGYVSAAVPLLVIAVSRVFLWPAFPKASRWIWSAFWLTQIFILLPGLGGGPIDALLLALGFAREDALVATGLLWGLITFGAFGFLLVSDFTLAFRSWRAACKETRGSKTGLAG